jgi:hypothetical protein
LQTIGLPKEEVMQITSNLDALEVVVSDYNLKAPVSILISITDSFGHTKSKIINGKSSTAEDIKDLIHNFLGFPTEEEIKARFLIPQVDKDELSENVQMNTTEQQAEIREALSEKFEDMDIDDLSPYEDMIDLIVKYGNPDMDLFPDDFLTSDGKMKLSAQYLASSPNLQSKLNENNDIMCEV